MEKTIYECKKCSKICNGGGMSYFVSVAGDTAIYGFSAVMEKFPDHACREEHMLQMVGDTIREIRGEGKVKVGAVEVPVPPADEGSEGQQKEAA